MVRINKMIHVKVLHRGAWVAQLVKHLIFGFGSGHDLRVVRLSLTLGFLLSRVSACLRLFLPLPLLARSLSNNLLKKELH